MNYYINSFLKTELLVIYFNSLAYLMQLLMHLYKCYQLNFPLKTTFPNNM